MPAPTLIASTTPTPHTNPLPYPPPPKPLKKHLNNSLFFGRSPAGRALQGFATASVQAPA